MKETSFYVPNAMPGEGVVLLLRRHWFTFSRRFIVFLALLFFPVIAYLILFSWVNDALDLQEGLGALIVVGFVVYLLSVNLFFFHAWIDYYLDVWVVTNERIMNIEQNGLFSRVVSELPLDNIQDVTVEVKGALATFYQYGDVIIQTAAENAHFHFDNVPRPYDVAKTILQLHENTKGEKPVPSIPTPR